VVVTPTKLTAEARGKKGDKHEYLTYELKDALISSF
jgi:type VI protein secretion system component Hcp